MARVIRGRAIVAGAASGEAVVSSQPISLWGGLDVATGEIIDRRHELSGRLVAGRVFVFPRGKGSSTGSATLLEAIRAGTAPAAIVNAQADPIVSLGAIVADELYGRSVPVVVLSEADFASLRDGDILAIRPDGSIEVGGAGEASGDARAERR